MPAQRKQTVLEPKGDHVRGTHQQLPRPRASTFVKIGSQGEQVVHQELDRTELARSYCLQHEDHANSRMVGQNPATGRNQGEDQERAVGDLLALGSLGVSRTQPGVRPGRKSGTSRCFNRSSSKQQSFNPACGPCPRCCSSNSGAVAVTRGDDEGTLEAVLEARPTATQYQVAKPIIEPEFRTAQPVPTDGYRYDNAPRRGLFRRGR